MGWQYHSAHSKKADALAVVARIKADNPNYRARVSPRPFAGRPWVVEQIKQAAG